MKITSISVPVSHYQRDSMITEENVSFRVYKEEHYYKVVPLINEVQRKLTGLPAEVTFAFMDNCIVPDKKINEETLDVIKHIVQELEYSGV